MKNRRFTPKKIQAEKELDKTAVILPLSLRELSVITGGLFLLHRIVAKLEDETIVQSIVDTAPPGTWDIWLQSIGDDGTFLNALMVRLTQKASDAVEEAQNG